MRKYETFFIVDPDLPDEVVSTVDDKIKSIVSSNGGTVLSYVPWGKKKLAYPVKKRSRGLYILMKFAAGPDLVAELERNMRLDERVLKFISVKLDDQYDPEQEPIGESVTGHPFEEDEEATGAVSESSDDEDEEEAPEDEDDEEAEE